MPFRKLGILIAGLTASLSIGAFVLLVSNRGVPADDAESLIENYIRASYARDFAEAYRLISIEDRRIKDEATYVRELGAYEGFTLQLAKSLAGTMNFSVLEDKHEDQR